MNVVFDFGGVLLRWQPDEFMPRLLPRLATDAASTRALVLTFFQHFEGDWGEFDRGRIDTGTLAERIARRIGIGFDEARMAIDAVVDELTPLPDTVALLRRLHARGHGLFYLSNMPLSYAALLESRNDFLGLFRNGVFSSRVGLVKPEPAIYQHAITAWGIDAHATVLIDDIERNLSAARAFGWRGILFRDASQCEASLRALGVL